MDQFRPLSPATALTRRSFVYFRNTRQQAPRKRKGQIVKLELDILSDGISF